jgi:hypothetical protein
MRRYLCLVLAVLASYSRELYLVGRTTGTSGHGALAAAGIAQNTENLTIELAGRNYTGRWLYSANGGAVIGSDVVKPTSGEGSILASVSDGSRLRCNCTYSLETSTGIGACQDNRGEIYDLQIKGFFDLQIN